MHIRPGFLFAMAVATAVSGVASARAGEIVDSCKKEKSCFIVNLSTGIDRDTGEKLDDCTTDTNWVIAPGSKAFVGQNPKAIEGPLPPPYITDDASDKSRWISIKTGNGDWDIDACKGKYIYETTFCLPECFDPCKVYVDCARWAADNYLCEILINGVNVWTNPDPDGESFQDWHSLGWKFGKGDFQSGENTIDFVVKNLGESEAFRFEGSVYGTGCCECEPPGGGDTPEPASLSLLAIGGAGLLFRRRK